VHTQAAEPETGETTETLCCVAAGNCCNCAVEAPRAVTTVQFRRRWSPNKQLLSLLVKTRRISRRTSALISLFCAVCWGLTGSEDRGSVCATAHDIEEGRGPSSEYTVGGKSVVVLFLFPLQHHGPSPEKDRAARKKLREKKTGAEKKNNWPP
ncbi:hypothetical protein GBAR_LOCUS27737, partial [Geodia barretti]